MHVVFSQLSTEGRTPDIKINLELVTLSSGKYWFMGAQKLSPVSSIVSTTGTKTSKFALALFWKKNNLV